jgi:hypothetical protein
VNTQGQSTMAPATSPLIPSLLIPSLLIHGELRGNLAWGNSTAEVFGLDSPQVNVIVEN